VAKKPKKPKQSPVADDAAQAEKLQAAGESAAAQVTEVVAPAAAGEGTALETEKTEVGKAAGAATGSEPETPSATPDCQAEEGAASE
jgi:hypothetical protein